MDRRSICRGIIEPVAAPTLSVMALYPQAWVRFAGEWQSAIKTSRRLRKLLKARIQQKFGKSNGNLWVP
jgi:hypothetical protein